jgi:hypothetical protein
MKTLGFSILIMTLMISTNLNNNDMGLFERFFANKENTQQTKEHTSANDINQLKKTAEMLDENMFWNIIEKSLRNTKNQEDQEQFLIKEIKMLTPHEMIGFRLRTDKLLYDTYNSEMWCAGYIMNGGCSDDAFEYFRNWIISRGREVFYKAKENPDNLITEVSKDIEFYDFEGFWYVALKAFNQKTGKDLYDYIDNENFKTKEGQYPQIEFTWQEENPESMKKTCPKLFEKMLKQ